MRQYVYDLCNIITDYNLEFRAESWSLEYFTSKFHWNLETNS